MADTMIKECVYCKEENDCLSLGEGWVCGDCLYLDDKTKKELLVSPNLSPNRVVKVKIEN